MGWEEGGGGEGGKLCNITQHLLYTLYSPTDKGCRKEWSGKIGMVELTDKQIEKGRKEGRGREQRGERNRKTS